MARKVRAVSSRAAHLSHIHVHTYMGYSDLQSHGSILVCLSLPNSTMQTHTNILPYLQLTANTHSNRNNAWDILINHIETLFLWLVSLETSQVSSDSSPYSCSANKALYELNRTCAFLLHIVGPARNVGALSHLPLTRIRSLVV